MNVLVIGASGRVGGKLAEKLLAQGHQVTGTTRQEDPLFSDSNYTQIALDLSGTPDHIKQSIPQHVDAIYFVSGSRGKNLLQVDMHGAIKTMQAAEKLGIKRYIMLSSIFALDLSKWDNKGIEEMKDYYIAKHYADAWLVENTTLNYTILQPAALKEKSGTGKIEVDVADNGENAIEDVAEVLFQLLDAPTAKRKVITMHQGETPIKEALASV